MHDSNTIKYVLVHEVSHMINIQYGHGKLFQMINARLLEHAICKGFCKYIDYSV